MFLNDSTGTFTLLGTTFGSNGSCVDLGDLDQDGDLDAWVGTGGNTIDAATGTILPAGSIPGAYTVTYNDGACTVFSQVEVKFLDTGVVVTDSTLYAMQDSATYQWVDCGNGYQPVSGQSGRFFQPSVSGTYALIVTYDGCTDTSACYTLAVYNSINDPQRPAIPKVMPNPVTDILHLITDPSFVGEEFVIKDLSGKVVQKGIITEAIIGIDISSLPKGVYLISAGRKTPSLLKFVKI